MPYAFLSRPSRRVLLACLLAFILACVLGLQLSTASFVLAQEETPEATPAIHSDYWPTTEWRTSSPEDQQMDSQKLDEMFQEVVEKKIYLHGFLVIRHGMIVSETYFQPHTIDEQHDLYSVTKSFVSTLVGIAIDQGYIDSLDHPVLDFFKDRAFTNVDDRKRAMTLRDLMTMQSGLDWDEATSAMQMVRTADWITFMLNLPMKSDPGTEFNYCTGCSHVVSAIIQKAAGMNTRKFAEQTLFGPLGIKNAFWRVDPRLIPIGGSDIRITARDMAKLGYLFLHHGEWDGQQIVSADWVKNASDTHVKTDKVSGTGAELDYGLMWWIYPRLKAYAALGYDGQTIFVIPNLDLIVVTTAATLPHDIDQVMPLIERYVVPAVKDAPADFISAS